MDADIASLDIMFNPRLLLTLALLALFLGGCNTPPPVASRPIATPTVAATATPVPEPTVTPTPLNALQATIEALKNAVTIVPPTPGPHNTAVAADDYLGMFERGWQIVADNYVRDNFNGVDWEAVRERYRPLAAQITSPETFWDMMEDMVAELNDNHSRFVRPDRFGAEFDIDLSNPAGSGLGWTAMEIWPAREDEDLQIWHVCASGPAASAGLQRGDVILAINGHPVARGPDGFERADYRHALVGNGSVTLTVAQGPDTAPTDVTLAYGGGAGCDGWGYGLLSEAPRVGYLRIPAFSGDSDTNTLDLIRRMEEETPLDGLIVDVRHNPGGNADRDIAIFTTGIFGKTGALRAGSTLTIYRIRGPVRWNETTSVVVLTDGASHSAAEYFATAMQQSGRALLVGMPTAGNTEGINSWGLPDGSLIRLAWMTLILPDGSTLEGAGVQPDIRAPLGAWGLREIPDVQLRAGYEAVLDLIGQSN